MDKCLFWTFREPFENGEFFASMGGFEGSLRSWFSNEFLNCRGQLGFK